MVALDPCFSVSENLGSGEPEMSIFSFSKHRFLGGNFLAQHKLLTITSWFSIIAPPPSPLPDYYNCDLSSVPSSLTFLLTHVAGCKVSMKSFNLIYSFDFFNEKKNVGTLK